MLWICPEYIGERCTFSRMIRCVSSVVNAMKHGTCFCVIFFVRKLNGVGSASPGCTSKRDQSMLRPSRRGGVPVLSLHPRKPSSLSDSPRSCDGGSPLRPAGYVCSPQWISPLRNVPVVTMATCAPTVRPSRSLMPFAVFFSQPGAPALHDSCSLIRCPLAIPPTAGLHDICAIRSTLSVNRAVLSPMRAAAIDASQPAWPAPTTTTSYCSVKEDIALSVFYRAKAPYAGSWRTGIEVLEASQRLTGGLFPFIQPQRLAGIVCKKHQKQQQQSNVIQFIAKVPPWRN